jgi:hypothetical protein
MTYTTDLKTFVANNGASDTAKQLNVLPQQIHDAIRKNIPVFVEHKYGKILNCYLKKKWGKLC